MKARGTAGPGPWRMVSVHQLCSSSCSGLSQGHQTRHFLRGGRTSLLPPKTLPQTPGVSSPCRKAKGRRLVLEKVRGCDLLQVQFSDELGAETLELRHRSLEEVCGATGESGAPEAASARGAESVECGRRERPVPGPGMGDILPLKWTQGSCR